MSEQSLQDVRSQLEELKRCLVASMADEQRLYQRYVESDREADRWRQRAELAVGKGIDDLARAALDRSNRHSAAARQFQEQYLEQKGYVEQMKTRLLELEAQAREGRALPRRPLDSSRIERSLAHLERWEERAREERARLAARTELDRDELAEKLAALEREDQLERQLAELKTRFKSRESRVKRLGSSE